MTAAAHSLAIRPGTSVVRTDEGPALGALLARPAEIVGTIVALLLYGVAAASAGGLSDFANFAGPTILSGVVGWALYGMWIRNVHAIWTPLFWYRVAIAAYFGVGSMVPLLVNADTRDLINQLFTLYAADVIKFNTVVALLHLLICLMGNAVLALWLRRDRSRMRRPAMEPSRLTLRQLGALFLIVGASVNYLILYPNAFGIGGFAASNAVSQVGQLAYISYFMLAYAGFRDGETRLVVIPVVLSLLDSVAGWVMLAKYAALFPVMMVPLAYLTYRPSLRRAATVMAFLLPYYFFMNPVITEARNTVDRAQGAVPTPRETIPALSAALVGGGGYDVGPEYQTGLMRLSYVNAGALAINLYDQGLPGNSLRDIFVVWIPRALYPDKPIITDLGVDFTFIATGSRHSSTSPSIPGEAYWFAGWWGVLLFAAMLTIVLVPWSVYSLSVMHAGAWHLFFVVLLGLRVGSRLDGMMVPDIIGPVSVAILGHYVLHFANRFAPARPGTEH